MKKVIWILTILMSVQTAVAQQQSTYTNFLLNPYFFNPAVAGSRDVHIASMGYRNQWTGFDEAPVSLNGNFYGSVRNEGKMGYGVSIISDRTGLMQNTGAYINYAHHFQLTDSLKLGIGVRPGYMQYRIRLYDARLADSGDDVLTGNILSDNAIDLQSGFHLYSDKFFVMGSVQHLLGKEIQFTSYNTSLAKHYNLIGGMNVDLKKPKVVLQPGLMIQHVNPVPTQYTVMMRGIYDKKYWAGLSYTTDASAGIAIGLQLKNRLTIGYGYDYTISDIRSYQNGSHEIMISFITTRKKPTLDEEDEELNKSILEEMQEKMKDKDNQ